MFRSKKDVDRHVKDIFIKLKNSEEKKLRCYNIAKLYYQVGDYESAKRYVSNYLEIRDKSPGAYKLLGQALEALGQKELAFTQYKISLELEPKQDDLILKVCELLSDMDVNIDMNKIKYWVERADKKFPHHPIVFELKEKMLNLEKPNGNDDDLEKLIISELSVRQTDVHLQVKLLKHYIVNHRLEDAYNQAAGIEATHSHRNNIIWYQSLSELLMKCKESKQSDWTFWIFYISVLERYTALCLKEQGKVIKKSITDAAQAVFNFDQSLFEFKSKNFSNHPAFIEHMLLHMWGQLHFHLACLILRKTKAGGDSWSEAGRLCGPLLLTALHVTPIDLTAVWTMHLKDSLKNEIHVWYREGSYRCSQAGHVLQDYARDNTKKLLDKIDKFCTSSWRDRVYQRIFIGRLYQDGKTTSYFVNCSISNPPLRLCSFSELKRFDEISEEVWPDSLHHQVWLGLRARPYGSQNKDNGPYPNQTSHVFCELQFSVYNLHQAAPDSLSRVDIDAFLNCAIYTSSTIEEQQLSGLLNPEKLPTLPADLTNTLCTCAQEQWWSYAYKVYSMDKQKPLDEDLGELRLELQRGLEVVRCLGNHGLHPVLLVHLARIFHYRAETLKEIDQENSDIPNLEARSEMYWSAAIPLLERLQNNQVIRITNSKFFNYQGKDMNNAELIKALEEGKLLLAQRFVRGKQYEKAIYALQALKCPEASFQQGQMYEKLADEIVSFIPKESLTSEIRSQHIIMLSKARECFYLTLDRLRSPGTNPNHPLNSELSTYITDIENKLKRIDPDLSRDDLSRNECDGMSNESYSSAHSGVDQAVTKIALPTLTGLNASINILNTPQKNVQRTPKQSSTPYRPQHQDILDLSRNRSEARPSPERLDAQIRSINQMIQTKDGMIQSITEQNKTILELNKTVMEKVEKLAKEVAELRKEIQKQRTQTVNINPNLEEDLCILSEDDYNDLNYNANQSGPASSISGNVFQSSHRHPYSQLVYPSATFQGYYPTGMSFSDPNAQAIPSLYPPNVYPMPVVYPNTRSKMPENILQQGLFMPPTNQSLQIPLQKVETSKPETTIKDAPLNKVPPVNVAITTSDTLPTTVPIVQPTLSVTIPPHFRQGSFFTPITTEQSVPHCYQISMPSQAIIPTTVNLPPLSNTLKTTSPNLSVSETPKQDATTCSTESPNSSDHEQDPMPDFVPVIPLPAEVEVTTGEEGQETLFCGGATLYRYVNNEWKERGTGNVKLLKDEEGKVRLLMRRKQVLKVCANHYLTPDMELTAKSNSEKAWLWGACDYADGELKLEKFCIKFKTVEESISFKEHFDKAKAKTVTPEKSKINTATTVIGGFSFTSPPIIQQVTTTKPLKVPVKSEVSPFAGFTFNKIATSIESFPTMTQKSATTGTTTTSQFTFSFTKTTTPLQSGPTTVPTVSIHSTPISSSQPISTAVTSENISPNTPQFSFRRRHAPAPNALATASNIVGVQGTGKFAMQTKYEEILFSEKVNNEIETFAATFKTYSQASQFHDIITSNQQKMVKDCIIAENLKKPEAIPNVQSNKSQESLSEMFKPPVDSWECSACYIRNEAPTAKCIACETPRGPVSSKSSTSNTITSNQVPLSQMFKPPAASWECKCCNILNAAENNYCVTCDTPKDPSLPPKPKTDGFQISTSSSGVTPTFTFDIPQNTTKKETSGFLFHLGSSNDVSTDSKSVSPLATKSDTKSDTSGAKFVFGMQQRPGTPTNKDSKFDFGTPGKSFEFNFVSKSSPTKSGGEENSEEEVVESDDIHFSPIIPLPDKIEVKTGEEDEEVLYSHRAKLFRFDKSVNEWKERGLGDIKLLRHKNTNKLRLVMRREQILKLCLNHFVLPNLELKPKDEKSWIWNAADYSEGEIEYTLFACRFKTSDIANNFKDTIEKWKKKLSLSDKTTEIKVEESTETSTAQDIEVLYEMKVTAEEKQAALKLQLPENFYAYKQKPDCPGCRGCKESDASLFPDRDSITAASKISTEDQKLPTTSAIQFLPKSINLSTASNEVSVVQTPISSTGITSSSIFKPGLYGTGTPQFTTCSLPTISGSIISFGNTDSTISNDKKTGFSFVMSPSSSSSNEIQKSITDKQNILTSENLKICSPITSQAQVTSTTAFSFITPTSKTVTTSIFGMAKLDNTGKNIFGGISKKDSSGLLKPSSINVSTNNTESIFSNNLNIQSKITTNTTTSLFGASTKSTNSVFTSASPFSTNLVFGPRTTASVFTISSPVTTNAFETITQTTSEAQKESDISFLPTANVSFSTLAAKSSQPTFKIDPNFAFDGAGSAVFGQKTHGIADISEHKTETTVKKNVENEEEECEQTENDDYDPHFEPIIPLPDIVEVHTGEEEEEKVFCERAKLYRYDSTTREWKERGVGNMKILHHAKYGRYRLLMRREQVHKVVCNFLITPDIAFNRLSTSHRAWIWAGMNYAEEQPHVESLSVKFKTEELATNFKDAIDKIQQTLNETREQNSEDSPVIEEPEDEENEEVDEEECEEKEEDDNDDDDQNSIIFEKRATLFTRASNENQWEPVASGNLIIYSDPNIFDQKIILKADETNKIVSNTIISTKPKIELNGEKCIWTAIDYALTPPTKRTLCARFSSVYIAQEMYKHFEE
ncbi:E3 SUMO-protein ligase RanBP2, partial [Eufriesea mexicana]